MTAKAQVEVDVVGAAQAERDLKKLKGSFESFGRELGGIFAGAAREAAGISFALAKVDPTSAAQKFRDYRGTVTEWSIATKRSVGDVKASFATLGNATLLPDDQVADFSRQLGKATYDTKDSAKAIEALRGSGLQTGRSLSEMGSIAETLHNQMGTSFADMPDMLGDIEAAADSLNLAGGPAALQDSIAALGSTLSQVSIKGKADAKELIDVLAAVSRNARTPEQAKALQSSLVSHFASGGEQMRLNLGIKRKDFYDENGNVKVNAENVDKLRSFYLRKTGGNVERAQSLASFSNNLGPQLAAALFTPGYKEALAKAQGAAPGKGYEKALADLQGTQHGKETAAQLNREREERENLGAKTNAAQQKVAGAMPDSSVARYFIGGLGGSIAGNLLGKGASKLGETALGALASSMFKVAVTGDKASLALNALGAVRAAGSVAGFAGKAGLVGLAGLAGYEAGSWIDKKTGLSTKIANALDVESEIKEESGVAKNKQQLLLKKFAKENAVKSYEAQGYSHGEAVNYAEHPDRAPMGPKQAPVDVNVKVTTDTASPLHVTQVHKGRTGHQ